MNAGRRIERERRRRAAIELLTEEIAELATVGDLAQMQVAADTLSQLVGDVSKPGVVRADVIDLNARRRRP